MFVFAYGSLLRRAKPEAACRLHGHRRGWGVAMDNRITIPGYKYFRDPATHERPLVNVCFLDIRPDGDAHVNGVVFAVDEALVEVLDRRERQYERHDVSAHVDADLGARVWAYRGRPEARRRCALGPTVIARPYLEKVRADFDSFDMLEEFDRTTEPPAVPVLDLERVDVPDYSGVT
jgi:Gamma-glutamyl cyclotransferase, AIG2-like